MVRADAAAAPAPTDGGGDGKKVTTFVAGIMWFFAHQLIGVGNDVIMKYTGSTLGVAQVVFLRFFFATITMLPVMLASGKDSFKTDRIPLHIARSVLLAAGIALYCQGLAIAPIAVVTTLNFTIPLFTLVMARIFLKETVDATRWIGTLVGFAGVMVVVQPGGAAFNPMWLCVLVSAGFSRPLVTHFHPHSLVHANHPLHSRAAAPCFNRVIHLHTRGMFTHASDEHRWRWCVRKWWG